MGMGRVGCMPCINCRKDELLEISKRFPEVIERITRFQDDFQRVAVAVPGQADRLGPLQDLDPGRHDELHVGRQLGVVRLHPRAGRCTPWYRGQNGSREQNCRTPAECREHVTLC